MPILRFLAFSLHHDNAMPCYALYEPFEDVFRNLAHSFEILSFEAEKVVYWRPFLKTSRANIAQRFSIGFRPGNRAGELSE